MRSKKITYKRRKPPFLKILIGLTLFISVGLIVIYTTFQIKTVEVVGESKYTEDEIKNFVLKNQLGNNSLYLYLKYKYSEPERIPFIQRVDVKLLDKNTVKIHVYKKTVTGCIEYMGEYLYFDKDGIIVESTQEKEEGIPVITGLSYKRVALNEQIEVQKQELFDTILNLSQLIKQNDLNVDTIKFDSDNAVTLYCGNIAVLLGVEKFYDEPLAQLKNILSECEGKVDMIDMRNFDVNKPVIGTIRPKK